MERQELEELLRNGESSGVEYKRDAIHPGQLARVMAGLLNLQGGRVLLGVEDDGTVSGLTRSRAAAEEWVMEAARLQVRPPTLPYWETVRWDEDRCVGVVTLPNDAPDRPYKSRRGNAWVTAVRAGTSTRDASEEEEARLCMASRRVQYGVKPVPRATLADLDERRLRDYFGRVLGGPVPADGDAEEWELLLVNLNLATTAAGQLVPTIDAFLPVRTQSNQVPAAIRRPRCLLRRHRAGLCGAGPSRQQA